MYFTLTNDYRLRLTNDRPDLSSERAPKKRQDRRHETSKGKQHLVVSPRVGLIPRHTD
jgi:hypothetical protein